jgi:hypothetical protein
MNGLQNVTTTMGERGPRIASSYDSAGALVLHVVWADLWFPGARTYARYSHSVDAGASWSSPTQASDVPAVDGLTVTAGLDDSSETVVVVFFHTLEGPPPVNASSATWLYRTYSKDGGASFNFPSQLITAALAPAVPAAPIPSCSMCMTRARVVGSNVLFAMRTAADNIRDHFLLNGSLTDLDAPFVAARVPTDPQW